MKAMSVAQVRARMTPAAPSIERLDKVVDLAERRLISANAKMERNRQEKIAALVALCHAKAERTSFLGRQGMLL